jgi:hypothetical protein
MPELDYKQMFGAAKDELKRLQEVKANIEEDLDLVNEKIDAMSKTYNAIAPLVGERPIPTVQDRYIPPDIDALKAAGISVAVRYVLDRSPDDDFTAATVRDFLRDNGWDWSNYKNPLSTVHTVLMRLVQSEVAKRGVKDGKRVFYSSNRQEPTSESGGSYQTLGNFSVDVTKAFPLGGLGGLGQPVSLVDLMKFGTEQKKK